MSDVPVSTTPSRDTRLAIAKTRDPEVRRIEIQSGLPAADSTGSSGDKFAQV